MWNPPTKKQIQKIPALYSQEDVKDKKVYMKFFYGGWTWYAMEIDKQDNDRMFGLVKSPLTPNGEFGYFSLQELKGIRVRGIEVDRDLYEVTVYSPVKLSDIKKKNL